MSGYILESRNILDSGIWRKPPLYFKVWHYLLIKAQYKDRDGLSRGQLFTTYDEIREACSYMVGYRKMTPTKKEIRDVFDWLRNPYEGHTKVHTESPMITTAKVTHGMVVTIVKYNDYQDPKSYEGHTKDDTKGTTKVTRGSQQGHNIIKKDKERKNIYTRANKFNNFDQRENNYDDLQKQLARQSRGSNGKRVPVKA